MKRGDASHGGLTLREIAIRLGISHARVQQLEKRALDKLRKEAVRQGIDLSVLTREPR